LSKTIAMPLSQLMPDVLCSYTDYLAKQFDDMVELIRGRVFDLGPAPSTQHQRLSSNLHRDTSQYFKNQRCRVFHAPCDGRLARPGAADGEVYTVEHPDLCVVDDPAKLDERGCAGPPDWIIEIFSPSTARKDAHDKMDIYQAAGLGAYWLVHPHTQTVLVYVRDPAGSQYTVVGRLFAKGDALSPVQFSGLRVVLDEAFED